MSQSEAHDFTAEIAHFLDQHREVLLSGIGRAELIQQCVIRFIGTNREQIDRACQIVLELYAADVEAGEG